MPENHFAELFRLVRHALDTGKRKDVYADIHASHWHDRPQGVIDREISGLARQYRNNVSPDPAHLIDAALAYEEVVNGND
jgi:hypothetical protein